MNETYEDKTKRLNEIDSEVEKLEFLIRDLADEEDRIIHSFSPDELEEWLET
jgi:hypothetical protein